MIYCVNSWIVVSFSYINNKKKSSSVLSCVDIHYLTLVFMPVLPSVTCHMTTGTVTMASHSQSYDMWPCWVQSYLINDICHSLPCVIRNDWMPFPFSDLSSSQVISILPFLSQTWHSMTTMIRLLWLSPSRHTMSCYLWQCNVAVKRGLICQKHDKTGHLQVIYPWWCNLNPDDGDCIHHVLMCAAL